MCGPDKISTGCFGLMVCLGTWLHLGVWECSTENSDSFSALRYPLWNTLLQHQQGSQCSCALSSTFQSPFWLQPGAAFSPCWDWLSLRSCAWCGRLAAQPVPQDMGRRRSCHHSSAGSAAASTESKSLSHLQPQLPFPKAKIQVTHCLWRYILAKFDSEVSASWGAQETSYAKDGHSEGPQEQEVILLDGMAIALQPSLIYESLNMLRHRK